MAYQRIAGKFKLTRNGYTIPCSGSLSWNLGRTKKTPIVGQDGKIHGYKEEGQPAFIEVEVVIKPGVDVEDIIDGPASQMVAELPDGRTLSLRDAVFEGDGTGDTEGKFKAKWSGSKGRFV